MIPGDGMTRIIRNLVFEGGGVLGIAYLGALDYLFQNGMMQNVQRVGGTSAGAITACLTSLNLSFEQLKDIANSLDYKKVPLKSELEKQDLIPDDLVEAIENFFGDFNCIYRLIHNYGWYSTDYFYHWVREVIANQFDSTKKKPPYTFADFKNPLLHKNNHPFWDLYMVGTNLSMKGVAIFSYETTPDMEVAEAVRISMSVPLFFEAVKTETKYSPDSVVSNVFCDGGMLNNYPLNLFDSLEFNPSPYYGVNLETLGVCFVSRQKYTEIDNLLKYIESLLRVTSFVQQELYESNPLNKARSILIDTDGVNSLDFNIEVDDETYQFLYKQGYDSAKNYFEVNKN